MSEIDIGVVEQNQSGIVFHTDEKNRRKIILKMIECYKEIVKEVIPLWNKTPICAKERDPDKFIPVIPKKINIDLLFYVSKGLREEIEHMIDDIVFGSEHWSQSDNLIDQFVGGLLQGKEIDCGDAIFKKKSQHEYQKQHEP